MKVCLIGASFETGNMGVGALTAGVIKSIKYRFPRADIFLLDYGKEEKTYTFRISKREALIQLVNLRFSRKLFLRNNAGLLTLLSFLIWLIPWEGARRRVASRNYYLSRIMEAEIVASVSGGDSFSDIYGLGRFFYVALPQLMAVFLEKKLVLLPQTIGPFESGLARRIARFIMERSEVIYSRDHAGIKEAQALMGAASSKKLRFCYDMGFVVDPEVPENLDLDGFLGRTGGDRAVVGLNISGLLYMGGYNGKNMFRLKTDYRELVRELIDFLIREKNADVMLVPHVYGFEEPESDSAAAEEIYHEMKPGYGERIFMARGRYDQSGVKHIIGLCDFFIGSRMHACIAALSQAVPSVAIGYSGKFRGVMESIDLGHIVADPRTMDKKEILELVGAALDRRDETREVLHAKMPEVKQSVLNVFRDMPL